MFEALNSCLGDMRLAFLVTGIPYLMPTPTSGRARTTRFTVAASLKANIIEAENEVKFNFNLGHESGFLQVISNKLFQKKSEVSPIRKSRKWPISKVIGNSSSHTVSSFLEAGISCHMAASKAELEDTPAEETYFQIPPSPPSPNWQDNLTSSACFLSERDNWETGGC